MKASVILLVSFVILLPIVSCEKKTKECPSCTDTVSWDEYGTWSLGKEGWDGHSNDGTSLIGDCGWTIVGNNNGGVGKVYAVENFNGGVVFVWAWGNFSIIHLYQGWCGSTKEGIKIGDDLEKFKSVYPDFQRYEWPKDSVILWHKTEKGLIEAAFSADNKLLDFYIGIDY